MKFERLMQIYWSKGLYYNAKLTKPYLTLNILIHTIEGFSDFTRTNFQRRFEISDFTDYKFFYRPGNTKNKTLNHYVSYIINSSSNLQELLRYSVIRLYLIKSFRGRAQAFGKPSRGQRTWSNAWTAYKINTTLRTFITQVNKNRVKKRKPRKFNYKVIRRKVKKPIFKFKIKHIKKSPNLWF